MRTSRQSKILDIISANEVETQQMLAELLRNAGYSVTQATISRDIKDLKLIKLLSTDGHYKYSKATDDERQPSNRFVNIFQETVQSVASSGNIIVVKTLSGCANAAGEAVDNLNIPHVLGSIAGDNTLMMIVDDPDSIPALTAQFNEMIRDRG